MRRAARAEASPQLVLGEAAPERFTVRENGLQFELSFTEGYSVGLFLDQRDNRRRLLTRHVAVGLSPCSPRQLGIGPWEMLNAFAYTCGFSVCAAKAGARTTSLDLSKRWLDWGKRNFALNQLDPAGHDFLYGEAFDWLRRLAKKQRLFDVIVLDPPTFSQSKESGVFQAEKDYGRLVTAALPLLRSRRRAVRFDQRGGLAAGRVPGRRGRGHPRGKTECPSAPLRPAAAGFPHLTRRTGLSEDRVAAGRVAPGTGNTAAKAAAIHGCIALGPRICGLSELRRRTRASALVTIAVSSEPRAGTLDAGEVLLQSAR